VDVGFVEELQYEDTSCDLLVEISWADTGEIVDEKAFTAEYTEKWNIKGI